MASSRLNGQTPEHHAHPREVQLVNRVEELKVLKDEVDKAAQGLGSVIFLHGEAGIGKTRLSKELRAYAASRGIKVLYGRPAIAFKMSDSPPYSVWKEVIRDYLPLCSSVQLFKVIGDYPAEVCKLVPEIRGKLGPVAQSLPIDPEYERDRLFEGVSQFIINISRETPLLIALDDLHLSDQSSILLLNYLARGAHKEHLLLLGAYRDEDVDERHPLSVALTDLNKERLLQSVQLKRMSLDDASIMIRHILQHRDLPEDFCELVYEKTRGNPFFIEEVIKSLKEDGLIHYGGDRWRIEEAAKIEFPSTIKSVIKSRVSRLDDECQKVLTSASFVGDGFSFETLLKITDFDESKLLGLVERMLETGLIKERVVQGEALYFFADIMVRDVVHGEVSHLRHERFHGSIGRLLEEVYAERTAEHLGELASHFLEANDKDKALDYFTRAGEKAAKIYANGEAAFYFQCAFRLLDEKEGKLREKASVLEKLGDIKRLVGEYNVCIKYWNDCMLFGKELGDNELISRLHCKIANVLWENMGDAKRAKEHHQSALEILETEPETVALATLYEDIASQSLMSGETGAALASAQKALDLAKKMNSYEAIARSYLALGSIMNWTGEKKRGLECLEKGLKIALDNDFLDIAVCVYNEIAGTLPIEEEEKVMEYYKKGYDLAKKVGTIYRQSWIAANLATRYVGNGDMNKAVLMAEESVTLDRKTGNLAHLAVSLGRLATVFQILGEWDKSEQYYNEAFSVSLRLNDFQSTILSYRGLGSLCSDKGDYAKAKEYYEKMYQEFEKTGARYHPALMRALRLIISTHLELGEIEKASSRIGILHDFAVKTNDHYLVAYEKVLRGMLLRVQKKWEESISELEIGRDQLEAIGANRWDAYTFAKTVLCECARAYMKSDRQDDREKAYSLLKQALETFQKMGARKDIEKIMRLIEVLHPTSTQTHEKTAYAIQHGYIEVRGSVVVTPRESRVGERIELEIALTNTNEKEAVLLTKIKKVIPKGFSIKEKSEIYRVEGDCLNMKGKRLAPLEKEEIKLVLASKARGTFHIRPKILYVDENGREKSCDPRPTTVTVKELGIKGWLKGET